MNIILLGPPGSGKGTQAEAIIKEYGVAHVSTGNMLRKEIADGTELGLKAKSIIEAGQLVSDDIILGMMSSRLQKDDCKEGFLLDGFPRTVTQADGLSEILTELGLTLDVVLNIAVSDAEVVKRLSSRRTCLSCGATYHLIYKKPKVDGICDACGKEIVQREDDKEETVSARLETYKQQTQPLIDYYRAKDVIADVDGERAIDAISSDVIEILKK
jgi:adenylate kinase